jgi:predicted nucleic acid-binding protein
MTAPIFVDTNILIYALDEADLRKQEAAFATSLKEPHYE